MYRYDGERWDEERGTKSTLELYNREKVEVKDENLYENDWGSTLLFRGRTNTLRLNWRKEFLGGDTTCRVCNCGIVETLEHFLVSCRGYDQLRTRHEQQSLDLAGMLFGGTVIVLARGNS